MTRTGTDNRERDQHMRDLICRLTIVSQVPASAAAPEGGPSSDEHPSRILSKGGGMDGHDWWRLYLKAPDRTVTYAEEELEHAHKSPRDKPSGETPQQERERRARRVLELHTDGTWTTAEMARDAGLTIGQVSKIIMAAAINDRVAAAQRKDAAEVIRLWEEDRTRTVMYLAARTGYTREHVHRILRKVA